MPADPRTSSIVIRPATVADIKALIGIASASDTAAHWTEQQYRAAFAGSSPKRLVFVAENDKVTGFVVASGVAGEWELENIAVDPDSIGRGVGSALVVRLLSELERAGANRVFLEVRESNSAARALYERCGFGVSGKRADYYHNPAEDAILYQKILSNPAPEIR